MTRVAFFTLSMLVLVLALFIPIIDAATSNATMTHYACSPPIPSGAPCALIVSVLPLSTELGQRLSLSLQMAISSANTAANGTMLQLHAVDSASNSPQQVAAQFSTISPAVFIVAGAPEGFSSDLASLLDPNTSSNITAVVIDAYPLSPSARDKKLNGTEGAPCGSFTSANSTSSCTLASPFNLITMSPSVTDAVGAVLDMYLGVLAADDPLPLRIVYTDDDAGWHFMTALNVLAPQAAVSVASAVRVTAADLTAAKPDFLSQLVPSDSTGPQVVILAASASQTLPLLQQLSNAPSSALQSLLFLLGPDMLDGLVAAQLQGNTALSNSAGPLGSFIDGMLGVHPARGLFNKPNAFLGAWESFFQQASPTPGAYDASVTSQLQYKWPSQESTTFVYTPSMLGLTVGSIPAAPLLQRVDFAEQRVWDAVQTVSKAFQYLDAQALTYDAAGMRDAVVGQSSFLGATGAVSFEPYYAAPKMPRFIYAQVSAASLSQPLTTMQPTVGLFGASMPLAPWHALGYWQPLYGTDMSPLNASYVQTTSSAGFLPYFSVVEVVPPSLSRSQSVPSYESFVSTPTFGTPPPNMYGACVVFDDATDTLWQWGGTLASVFSPYNEWWSWSAVTMQWRRHPTVGAQPVGHFYGGCMLSADYVYVFGGITSDGVIGDMWRFRLSTSTWHQIDLGTIGEKSTRSQFGFAADSTLLAVFSGRHIATRSFEIWMFDPAVETFTIRSPVWKPQSWLQPQIPPLTKISGASILSNLSLTIYPAGCKARIMQKDVIFIFGGYNQDITINYVYDIAANTLSPFFAINGTNPRSRALINAVYYARQQKIFLNHGWSEGEGINWDDVWSVSVACPGPNCGLWQYETSWGDQRDSFLTVRIGNSLVNSGGWGAAFIHNDMYTFDVLQQPQQTPLQLSPDYARPPARKFHSLTALGQFFLLFGGHGFESNDTPFAPLNDLWLYDAVAMTWSPLVPTNVPPSGRFGHVGVALRFALFIHGGTDGDVFYDELWSFSMFSSTWELITAATTSASSSVRLSPAARAFHIGQSINNDAFVVFGGVPSLKSGALAYSDLWQYTLTSNTWTLLLNGTVPGDQSPFNITSANPNNTISVSGPSVISQSASVFSGGILYSLGGWDNAYNPVPDVWSIDPLGVATPYGWKQLSPLPMAGNGIIAAALGSQIYAYGGLYFEVVATTLFAYDIASDTWRTIAPTGGFTPTALASGAAAVLGLTALFFGGSAAQFDDVHEPSFTTSTAYTFTSAPACNAISSPVELTCQPCGPGTVAEGVRCVPCPKGTYESNGQCIECDAGYAGSFAGASTFAVCLPCAYGMYAPQSGMTECLSCTDDQYCPVASRAPLSMAQQSLHSIRFNQSQPPAMELHTNQVADQTTILEYILLALIGLLVLYYLFLHGYGDPQKLAELDVLFSMSHFHLPDQPMWKRQTAMGGLCTIIGGFVLLFIVASLCLPFFLDNYVERKSLVPNASYYNQNFTGEFDISVMLVGFSAPCVVGAAVATSSSGLLPGAVQRGACVSQLTVSVPSGGLSPDNTITSTNPIVQSPSSMCEFGYSDAGGGDTVVMSGNSSSSLLPYCQLSWHCPNCIVNASTLAVNFAFLSPNSFASLVSWSSRSFTGIPDGYSVLNGTIASEPDRFLRGTAQPTTISIDVTQTTYSQSNDASSTKTGYHLDYLSASLGTTTVPQRFYTVDGLVVQFSLTRALNTLVVLREAKQTPIQFVSGVLGGLSGVIGALALILLVFETGEDATLDALGKKARSAEGRLISAISTFRLKIVKQALMAQAMHMEQTSNGWEPDSQLRWVGTVAAAPDTFGVPEKKKPVPELPASFTGAADLEAPVYMAKEDAVQVTLPSRLKMLGRHAFYLASLVALRNVGSTIMAQVPMWTDTGKGWCSRSNALPKQQWIILPWAASKTAAKLVAFVRVMLVLMAIVFIIDFFNLETVNVGKTWVVGCVCAFLALFQLTQIKRSGHGTMGLLRSMGAPDIEEFMFSYCWKVQPETVRTFAKAVWQSGVGVWIDVIKLSPGDEIRPLLRTTIKRVYKVVVFLCPEYCASPNCCVEMQEAVKHPEKCVFCIIKPVDETVLKFVTTLGGGSKVIHGFEALAKELDQQLCNPHDHAAFAWWRSKKITGASVPDSVVPTHRWPISLMSLTGKLWVGEGAQTVGPLYLSGDCRNTGVRFMPPWLLLLTLFGWLVNCFDLYYRYHDTSVHYSNLDYAWLASVALMSLCPLLGLKRLIDTRIWVSVGLKPLLASNALLGGVKINVVGNPKDPLVQTLRRFLYSIGHLHIPLPSDPSDEHNSLDNSDLQDTNMKSLFMDEHGNSVDHMQSMIAAATASGEFELRTTMAGSRMPEWSGKQQKAMSRNTVTGHYEVLLQPAGSLTSGKRSRMASSRFLGSTSSSMSSLSPDYMVHDARDRMSVVLSSPSAISTAAPAPVSPSDLTLSVAAAAASDGANVIRKLRPLTIFVIDSFEARDCIFSSQHASQLDRSAIFIWSHPSIEHPFGPAPGNEGNGPDTTAQRMMKYLVLVSKWEKDGLADSIFSALAIRAVELCHQGGANPADRSKQD